MIVHASKHERLIVLQLRAEGEGVIGDLTETVRPGETMFGRTYDEWTALPEGPVAVEARHDRRVEREGV